MPESNQSTTKSQSNGKRICIGVTDLSHDVDQIQSLLQAKAGKGILLSAWNCNARLRYFYRPNESDRAMESMTCTIRKFLAITSVLGGRAELKVIENEKDIPKKAADFDAYFTVLREGSKIFD